MSNAQPAAGRGVPGWVRVLTGRGRVGRAAYLAWGVALLLVRYNLDRFEDLGKGNLKGGLEILHTYVFQWNPIPPGAADGGAWQVLLGFAPFLGLGLVLSRARLRDAGLRPAWILLFAIPAVRVLAFVLLASIPASGTILSPDTTTSRRWTRWLPSSRWGCALASALCAGVLGVGVTWISTELFGQYGWTLFVAMPFVLGWLSAMLYGQRHPMTQRQAQGVACLAVLAVGLLLLGLAIEGVLCLLMATPVAALLAALGGSLAWAMLEAIRRRGGAAPLMGVVVALPLLVAGEKGGAPEPPVFSSSTEVVVHASPEALWPQVVDVAALPAHPDVWSRAGLATFRRAWTEGSGVGAVRYCEFDTGVAREPVEVWDPPRRLRLRVENTPTVMQELTPYRHVHPRHLDGFYEVRAAEFELEPVPGGTLLRGTTWYRHGLWPSRYWAWWCDHVVRDLQRRVLTEAGRRAEAGPAPGPTPALTPMGR